MFGTTQLRPTFHLPFSISILLCTKFSVIYLFTFYYYSILKRSLNQIVCSISVLNNRPTIEWSITIEPSPMHLTDLTVCVLPCKQKTN